MDQTVHDRLRNVSVFKRLWASLMLVAVIPVLLLCVTLLLVFWNSTTERVGEYAGNLTKQAGNYIELQLNQLTNDIANFTSSGVLRAFLRDYAYLGAARRYAALEEVRGALSRQFSNLSVVADVTLLTNDRRNVISLYSASDLGQPIGEAEAQKTIDDLIGSVRTTSKDTHYAAPEGRSGGGLIIAKRIVDSASSTIVGYITLQMREEFISSLYSSWVMNEGCRVYVADAAGNIFSSSDPLAIGECFDAGTLIKMAGGHGVMDGVPGPGGIGVCLLNYDVLGAPGLYVASAITHGYLMNDSLSIALIVVLVTLLLLILSTLIASVVVKSITVPIAKLTARMRLVQQNRLEVGEYDLHGDELANVSNTFNQTVERLRESIEDIRRAGQEKTRLEIKALTAQINPHFLTNALGTVKRLANLQGARNVESMVASLINLLSALMGKGTGLIPIADELELLEDYINLQKYRHFGDIAFDITVEDAVRRSLIPVFTLQPLVENALRHGKLDQRLDARVVIKAYLSADRVMVSVTDNGAGMTSERLSEVARLASELPGSNGDHIGIANVAQRIRLCFGDAYQMSVDSDEGLFTRMDITLPYTADEQGGGT